MPGGIAIIADLAITRSLTDQLTTATTGVMSSYDEGEYIPVEDVAVLLGVGERQAHKYGAGPDAKIRTIQVGRRVLYYRPDVETVAAELNRVRGTRPSLKKPRAELMPVGEVLAHIKTLESDLLTAGRRIGYLEAQLEMSQRALADHNELKQRLEEAERERAEMRIRITELEEELRKRPQ